MAERFLVGIDGGASKTGGMLADTDGRVLAAARVGGSAIVGKPSAESLAVLVALFSRLCDEANVPRTSVAFCSIGLNGVDFEDERPMQRESVAAALDMPVERLELVNDAIAALWGASDRPAVGHWQHGSSFTGAYRADYGCETLFDSLNAGRCFDIRGEAMAMVARMIDGRTEPTPLKELMLEHVELPADEYAESVFRRRITIEKLRGIPRLIFDAFEAGEPGAAWLVDRAVGDYAAAAAAMITHTGHDDAVATFGGGVIKQAGPTFWQDLNARIHAARPRASVAAAALEPEYGAAVMAAFSAGCDPQAFFPAMAQSVREQT